MTQLPLIANFISFPCIGTRYRPLSQWIEYRYPKIVDEIQMAGSKLVKAGRKRQPHGQTKTTAATALVLVPFPRSNNDRPLFIKTLPRLQVQGTCLLSSLTPTMNGLASHQKNITPWNANVPTGKHRGNGGSAWLASSKSASLPFQSSGYTINPVKLSKLKKLMARYWPSDGPSSSLTTRRASVSIDRPAAASTTRFVLLCALWYLTSALSSNTGKTILTQFRYPVTLTFIQFGFVAFYCLLFMSPLVRFSRLRAPTKAILSSTVPMGMFQVGGHMFSSMAISRVPVSTVHTIKVRITLHK